MECDLDVELLINEVRKYPEIWKVGCDEYRDKIKKKAAWLKVCEVLFTDFNEKSEEEKDELSKKPINKWKNIKDTFLKYVRKRKRPGKAPQTRRYIYAKHLSFLLEAQDLVGTQPSPDTGEASAESEFTEEIPHEVRNLKIEDQKSSKSQPAAKRRKDLETTLINFMNSPIQSAIPPTSISAEFDEDKSFLDSLIPALKTFNLDQKLEFRSEVLNVIQKIRYSNTGQLPLSQFTPHQPLVSHQHSQSLPYQCTPFTTANHQHLHPSTQTTHTMAIPYQEEKPLKNHISSPETSPTSE